MQSCLVALGLLTIVPVGRRTPLSGAAVARSRFWYPPVAALLGSLLGGAAALLAELDVGPSLAALLVLLAWVVLTGALHVDGLCDLADALFGGRTPEERLRILKDPHLGTFGLVAGVLLLLGKWVLLRELLAGQKGEVGWPIGSAVAAARCLALCLAAGAVYPRPAGTAKALVEAMRGPEALLFGALAGLFCLAASPSDPLRGLAGFVAAGLATVGLGLLCRRRLGGITGDCLGAAIELTEVLILSAALLPAR